MRTMRILALFCICFAGISAEQNRTVTGRLTRVMAVGGESTGWAIELASAISIDGKPVHSIEVSSSEIKKFKTLENKYVEAAGAVSNWHGVERGDRAILAVSSIREVSLTGSEWLLEDLAGAGAIDNVQATLTFPEANRVAGKASCNRFFGPAKIDGNAIQLGPFGATRMACPEAVMNQEARYLNALQAAQRFEWKDPYLLLHSKGVENPLRFTRLVSPQK
jgi:heat shock protein HslJ